MATKSCRMKFDAVVLIVCLICIAVSRTLAQPPSDALPVTAIRKGEWRSIRVHHVRPSVLAWWIDPVNQAEPDEYRRRRELSFETSTQSSFVRKHNKIDEKVGGGGFGGGGGVLEIPVGIEAIVAVDARNEILVYSDEAGWAQLKALISYLDKPIRSVEIELNVVYLDAKGLDILGVPQRQVGKPQQSLISSEKFKEALAAAKATGHVRFLNSPRVTTQNKMVSYFSSTHFAPARLTLDGRAEAEETVPEAGSELPAQVSFPATHFMMGKKFVTAVTSTINNDDTITLFVSVQEPLYLMRANEEVRQRTQTAQSGSAPLPPHETPDFMLENANALTTVTNLKNNQTIVLGGLKSAMSLQGEADVNADRDAKFSRFYFITARVAGGH